MTLPRLSFTRAVSHGREGYSFVIAEGVESFIYQKGNSWWVETLGDVAITNDEAGKTRGAMAEFARKDYAERKGKINHKDRAHALLSASGAARWIACPPSARLEELEPESSSEAAEQGTAAHEYSELLLEAEINGWQIDDIDNLKRFQETNEWYDSEMENHIQDYVAFVMERFNFAKTKDPEAFLSVEERLDFSQWVPDGFGTGDIVIVTDHSIEVIDLKYGRGKVDAPGNPQPKLYALGAYNAYDMLYNFDDSDEVIMTIYQPRLSHISTDITTFGELLAWGEEVAAPAAQLAYKGEGKFQTGEHCLFCKIATTCRQRAEEAFGDLEVFETSPKLSIDEIAEILPRLKGLKKWADDLEKEALKLALDGKKVKGYKLVAGRTRQVISDPEAVAANLMLADLPTEKIYKPAELLAMTNLKKTLGNDVFAELVEPLLERTEPKPTLVPESDSRPELPGAEEAFDDLADLL